MVTVPYPNRKLNLARNRRTLINIGRGERIRTSDHLHPMQVRYQAALRPEVVDYNNKPQR